MAAARGAYEGIDFKDRGSDQEGWFISIELPTDYQSTQVLVATDQLAKGAFNLSALLNKIKWQ